MSTASLAIPVLRPASGPVVVTLRQIRAEVRGHVRAPEFVVPVLVLPIVLYLIFGGPRATEPTPFGSIGLYMMVGFSIYGVLNVVLFAIGQAIADERGRGYLRLMRTTPLPAWAYMGAKLGLAAVLIGLIVGLIGLVGDVTGAGVPAGRWLSVMVVLTLGGLAIAPIGFLVGFLARPHGAGAMALLLLFPLSLASGVFMPVDQLPKIVRDLSVVTPTYHLSELARWSAGIPTTGTFVEHVAVIAAWSLAGVVAMALSYRRMVGQQFA